LIQENEDLVPFDYGQIFHKPSAIDLASRFKLGHTPGTAAYNQQAWGQPATQAPMASPQPMHQPPAPPAPVPQSFVPQAPATPPIQPQVPQTMPQTMPQAVPQAVPQAAPPQAAPGTRTRRSVVPPQVSQDPFAPKA
jgi:hypothetical protein